MKARTEEFGRKRLYGLFVDRWLSLLYNPGMEIKYREKKWDMKGGMTARDALKKIGIDPESVLITINGKLVTDDALLKDTDQVKLVAVVSGGMYTGRQVDR